MNKDRKAMICLIALALMVPLVMPGNAQRFARHVNNNPVRFLFDDVRVTTYMNALDMLKDHPVIGVGINNFIKTYPRYRGPRKFNGAATDRMTSAHNDLLSVACETGFVGLAAFICFLAMLFIAMGKVHADIPCGYFRLLHSTVVLCIITYLINGATSSFLFSSRVALLFWYLSGLAIGMRVFAKPAEQKI